MDNNYDGVRMTRIAREMLERDGITALTIARERTKSECESGTPSSAANWCFITNALERTLVLEPAFKIAETCANRTQGHVRKLTVLQVLNAVRVTVVAKTMATITNRSTTRISSSQDRTSDAFELRKTYVPSRVNDAGATFRLSPGDKNTNRLIVLVLTAIVAGIYLVYLLVMGSASENHFTSIPKPLSGATSTVLTALTDDQPVVVVTDSLPLTLEASVAVPAAPTSGAAVSAGLSAFDGLRAGLFPDLALPSRPEKPLPPAMGTRFNSSFGIGRSTILSEKTGAGRPVVGKKKRLFRPSATSLAKPHRVRQHR